MRLKDLSKAAVVAGTVAVPLAIGMPSAAAAPAGVGSAYALAATGPVDIPATPSVTSDTRPHTKSVAALPDNPIVRAKALNTAARAGYGRASVLDLAVPRAGLTANVVTAKCTNGRATSKLAKLVVNGRKITADSTPNSRVSVDLEGLGTASLVLNKQTRGSDGRLTVTALELRLPLPGGKAETIRIASATCGPASDDPSQPGDPGTPDEPEPTPSGPPATPSNPAPTPTPVTGDLPVTG